MKVAVWDTYVRKSNGKVMHFDIIVDENTKDEKIVYSYGELYLKSKNETGQIITAKECRFCHIEKATPQVESEIQQKGYYILEMENC